MISLCQEPFDGLGRMVVSPIHLGSYILPIASLCPLYLLVAGTYLAYLGPAEL
jgi:hypothetical protein